MTVPLLKHFSDRHNCCTTKGLFQNNLNLLFEWIFTVQFRIQHIFNLKLIIFLFYFSLITILFDICKRGKRWCALNRYHKSIDWDNEHLLDLLIFTSYFCDQLIYHKLILYLLMYAEWYSFGNESLLIFWKVSSFLLNFLYR